MSKYDDIINLPHHVSKKHPQMSMEQRAAQFAPFITATSKSTPSVTASCLVLVGDATGIADITIDDDTEAAYYSLDGVKLATKPQQEGVYIRVKDGKSQKMVVRKK